MQTKSETVFERILRLAEAEREARRDRPLSAALVAAAERHIAKNGTDFFYQKEPMYVDDV